jgi:RNA polymerase sigma-70 factor (ECF subfamily)
MASKNIQELAEKFIKTLSEKDFVELYKRIKPGLLNHCRSILIESESAEDAVSNTMAKIWTKISQYDPGRGNFSTWVYNIARNESLVIKKSESRYLPLIQETAGDGNEVEKNHVVINTVDKVGENNLHDYNYFDSNEKEMETLYDSVIEKMKDLPEIYKEILFDREILRMKYQEIAEKHGMKKRAIATRIRRARLKVREMFPGAKLNFND